MYKNSSFVDSLVYFYNAAVIIRSEIFFYTNSVGINSGYLMCLLYTLHLPEISCPFNNESRPLITFLLSFLLALTNCTLVSLFTLTKTMMVLPETLTCVISCVLNTFPGKHLEQHICCLDRNR